jgi:hypothetical protein
MVSVKVWGRAWRGKKIIVQCENLASVIVLNSGRSRDHFLQSCVREIAYLSAIGEFQIRAVHIPGIDNRLPDLLSRWSSEIHRNQFLKINRSLAMSEVEAPERFFRFINDW